eukprot:8185188-Pyramimonas_sp.AAC.1
MQVFIILLIPVVMASVMVREARGLVIFSTIAALLIFSALVTIYGELIPHLGGDLYNAPLRMTGQLAQYVFTSTLPARPNRSNRCLAGSRRWVVRRSCRAGTNRRRGERINP